MISYPKNRALGLSVANFSFAVGSGWVSILGYLLLDLMGWRNYILFVSIPWFIPPIVMFHMFLTPKFETDMLKERENSRIVAPEVSLPKHTFLIRLAKLSIVKSVLMFNGSGIILLLPALLRATKLADAGPTERCEGAVGGTEFLIMAGITGGVNTLARSTSLPLFRKFNFRPLMTTLAAAITASFGTLTVWDVYHDSPNLALVIVTISVIIAAWSIMLNEVIIFIHAPGTFGFASTQLATATVWGMSSVGLALGNGVALFMVPQSAVLVNLVVSILLICSVLSITERDTN